MLSQLKKHPFAVEAFFESSLVLTFAVHKEELEHMIPECLTLDLFNNKWAFIAVALVKTKDLRPKGFPKFMGNDFFLIGYRIFVRYVNKEGKNLRGLYILRSETDKKKMEFLGNIFTQYKYTTTDIQIKSSAAASAISSVQSDFRIVTDAQAKDIPLPASSPFSDWKEARRFAGPLPFTFSYDHVSKEVLIVEGVRQNWTPEPVKVGEYHFAFLDRLKLQSAVLANAFMIKNIPYHWKKGKTEQWK
jgi:hypothetical protein